MYTHVYGKMICVYVYALKRYICGKALHVCVCVRVHVMK